MSKQIINCRNLWISKMIVWITPFCRSWQRVTSWGRRQMTWALGPSWTTGKNVCPASTTSWTSSRAPTSRPYWASLWWPSPKSSRLATRLDIVGIILMLIPVPILQIQCCFLKKKKKKKLCVLITCYLYF